MNKRYSITDLVILITVASTTLYIVFRNIPIEIGNFTYLWAPLSLAIIIFTRPKSISNSLMFMLLLYGIFFVGILQYTVWRYMDESNRSHILFEFYYLIVMTSILNFYLSKGEYSRLSMLSKWAFIFSILSLIATNLALSLDSEVVRQSAATGKFTIYQEKVFKITGSMGYSYVQAIVYLIPVLIYNIKKRQRLVFGPKLLIVIIILILITEIRSQVFANILVASIITLLSILATRKRFNFFIITLSVSIAFMLVPNSFYSGILHTLSQNFDPSSELNHKLKDFASFIQSPDLDPTTEIGGRAERYPMLLDALLTGPGLGVSAIENHKDITLGGHLYWMNRLALWGIPGFLFFIFILYRLFKYIMLTFENEFRLYYLLSIVAFVLLGLSKAIGGREPWLMLIVVIPGLYYLSLNNRTSNRLNILNSKKATINPTIQE